jgi:hypothetical protein
VHGTGKVFGSFELTLNERLVDDHLRGDVGQFTPLPDLYLLSCFPAFASARSSAASGPRPLKCNRSRSTTSSASRAPV